jgi:hypothetical protein
MDNTTKAKVQKAILDNPHLFSARHNSDYLTIGIEIAPDFPKLAKRVDLVGPQGQKEWAHMVPIEDVKAALAFTG